MRTAEELVQAVHRQAGELRKRQLHRRLALTGGVCCALSFLLLGAIGAFGGLWHSPLNAAYAGASLLDDSAGGYVLVAVVAFMLGVVITVFIKWEQRGKRMQARDQDPVGGSSLPDDALMTVAGGKKALGDGEEKKPGQE